MWVNSCTDARFVSSIGTVQSILFMALLESFFQINSLSNPVLVCLPASRSKNICVSLIN